MKLEINKREAGKSTNVWKLNNIPLNNQGVKKEIKGKPKRKQMKMETQHMKTYGMLQMQF